MMGDPGAKTYMLASGKVRVTVIDDDRQEVVVADPAAGEFFGFAPMLDQTRTRRPRLPWKNL
jgi:CRP-like cAMP-binding protein